MTHKNLGLSSNYAIIGSERAVFQMLYVNFL